jgi:hypothetical protein
VCKLVLEKRGLSLSPDPKHCHGPALPDCPLAMLTEEMEASIFSQRRGRSIKGHPACGDAEEADTPRESQARVPHSPHSALWAARLLRKAR